LGISLPLPPSSLVAFATINQTGMTHADVASLKQAFSQWLAKSSQKKLNIFITGKSGVGKSRLVNAIVGRQVVNERHSKNNITPYTAVIEDIEVFVWDSPGLQDGTCNEELYMSNLAAKLEHGFDLMIYCIKMDDARFYPEDKKAMKTLTRGLGKDLWKKTVIALTFANKIEDPDGEDEEAFFKGEKDFWEKAIDEFLNAELGIPFQVRRDLPVVPAGNYKKLRLPTTDHWLAELLSKCLSVMTHSAGLALYQINKNRLKFSCSEEMAAACSCQSRNDMSSPSETSSGADDSGAGDIPRETPLDQEQEDKFLSKMWTAFVMCGVVSIAATVTFDIFQVLFRH